MPKHKFYTIWSGYQIGICSSWEVCQAWVKGFPNAQYKGFDTREEAVQAWLQPAENYFSSKVSDKQTETNALDKQTVTVFPPEKDIEKRTAYTGAEAIAVDAACSGNPGPMEYRGVALPSGKEVFHFGPIKGTNNIGEFLAIVHALALLLKEGQIKTIYSDSHNALLWIAKKKCHTTLTRSAETETVFSLITRAELWLKTHDFSHIPLEKWNTKEWGEIPADFGRK